MKFGLIRNICQIAILSLLPFGFSLHANENIQQRSTYISDWESDSRYIWSLLNGVEKYIYDESDTEVQREYKEKQYAKELYRINAAYRGKQFCMRSVKLIDVRKEESKTLNEFGRQKIINFLISKMGKNKFSQMVESAKKNNQFDNEQWFSFVLSNLGSSIAFVLELNMCERCYDKSILYNAYYEVPVPDQSEEKEAGTNGYSDATGILDIKGISNEDGNNPSNRNIVPVDIIKSFSKEEDVIKLKKGEVSPLQGVLSRIEYEYEYGIRKITIRLK